MARPRAFVTDPIDLEAARARGIVVGNTPGVLAETTADLAFALRLSEARRICEGDRFVGDRVDEVALADGPGGSARPRPRLRGTSERRLAASAAGLGGGEYGPRDVDPR